jgi:hypothetical protein
MRIGIVFPKLLAAAVAGLALLLLPLTAALACDDYAEEQALAAAIAAARAARVGAATASPVLVTGAAMAVATRALPSHAAPNEPMQTAATSPLRP